MKVQPWRQSTGRAGVQALSRGKLPAQASHLCEVFQNQLQGERGVLRIPGNFLLRLRHNSFYSYLESRVLRWVEDPGRG